MIPTPLTQNRVSVLGIFLGLLALTVSIAIMVGAVNIPLFAPLSQAEQTILYAIRLPRILLAMIVGAALGISGAALQGLFRNPLADPSLIGIASGAALAVALTIVLAGTGAHILGLYGLSIVAFAGALLTSWIIFRIATIRGRFSVTHMLLAGIAINALVAAATGFLTYISSDQQLRLFTFWTMGSLDGALWSGVFVAASIVLPVVWILMRNARALNILVLGEEEAHHLGVDSVRLKRVVIVCTALSVGAAVSLCGIIGFVGLVVPHLIRLLCHSDHRMVLPGAAILGALLLVAADTLARIVLLPAEIPVGIVTSLIGAPFFLWLLVRQYRDRFGL